jgi:hypothetical protein
MHFPARMILPAIGCARKPLMHACGNAVRERLVRDHLGKFIVLRQDEVFGPFDTFGEAVKEGYRRFGDVPIVVKDIRPEEPPDFVSIVDLNHPSIKRLD